MPYRAISIISPEFGKIPLNVSSHEDEPNVIILEANQPFGTIKWTISNYKKFNLWHATYQIKQPVRLIISINKQYLGFLFVLKNRLRYYLKGLSSIVVEEHQYDLFYAPSIQLEYNFDSKTYIICGFNYSTSSFKIWSNVFKPLKSLITSVNSKVPFRLRNTPATSTPRMIVPLFNMLQCSYSGLLKKRFLSIKTSEITFYTLQNADYRKLEFETEYEEIKRMLDVKEYLLNNLTNPGTTHQIALRFGLNDFKLKKSFKSVFGTSIYAFLLEERLLNAQQAILETDLPLKQIAELAGYSELSPFSNAFKSKFGFSPSTLRKQIP